MISAGTNRKAEQSNNQAVVALQSEVVGQMLQIVMGGGAARKTRRLGGMLPFYTYSHCYSTYMLIHCTLDYDALVAHIRRLQHAVSCI